MDFEKYSALRAFSFQLFFRSRGLTKYKFKAALAIWSQLTDSKHIAICRTKAVAYYVDNHKFSKALKFANRDKQLVVYTEKKQIEYLISKSKYKNIRYFSMLGIKAK